MGGAIDLEQFTRQLEELRDGGAAGTLDEERLWRMLADARAMQDLARGSNIEPCVNSIYELLECVWRITRTQKRLAELRDPPAPG